MTTNTDGAMPELPENIREGAPYDNARFEELCREHDIWGTAESAMCAVFWRTAIQQAAGAVPEATQEQIESLDDLVTLVRRLVHALHKAAPDDVLADHAADYLQRKGFNKGPFRSATFPAPPKQQPVHLGGGDGCATGFFSF